MRYLSKCAIIIKTDVIQTVDCIRFCIFAMQKLIKEIMSWLFIIMAIFALITAKIVVISGPSMAPTLQDGQVWLGYQLDRNYDVGDIVYFTPPNNPATCYVKRIQAVAGDTLCVNADGYIVVARADGQQTITNWYIPSKYSYAYPITIEDGYVFVIGDNVGISNDSRYFGPVAIKSIKGHLTPIKLADRFSFCNAFVGISGRIRDILSQICIQ